jgi:hypothetical protein
MSVCSSIFVLFHVLALNYEQLILSAISDPPKNVWRPNVVKPKTRSGLHRGLGLIFDTTFISLHRRHFLVLRRDAAVFSTRQFTVMVTVERLIRSAYP